MNYWPLHKVLHEKYRFEEAEARAFADFLMPMLEWDPEKRASAETMLSHPWLTRDLKDESRFSKEEMQEIMSKKKAKEQAEKEMEGDEEEVRVEMSKLQLSPTAYHEADDELSTFSVSDLDDSDLNSLFDEDSDESLSHVKPKTDGKKKDNTLRLKNRPPLHIIKRDIATGRTINNSYTGPYPEDTDHLHIDKGANS